MRIRLVTGFSISAAIGLVVLFACMIGIFVSGWKNNSIQNWNYASAQTQSNIELVLNASLNAVKFAAKSVPNFEFLLTNKSIPMSGYNPYSLIQMFDAFDQNSNFNYGSMGIMMHHPNKSLPNAKLSWQIAKGFWCNPYIYAFSDLAINPMFWGYCASTNGTVNYNILSYNESDWGLKPQEKLILDGGLNETFLPVFNLLEHFTLTFESGYPAGPGPKYAVTFAELDLDAFSNYIAKQVDIMSGKGIAYIFETQTGAMIASNIPSTIVNGTGFRYFTFNSSSYVIQSTFSPDNSSTLGSDWIVSRLYRSEPGLDWTIVVAIKYSDVYGDLNYAIMVACLVSMAVLIVLIILLCIGNHFFISKPVQHLVQKLKSRSKGEVIDGGNVGIVEEFNLIDEAGNPTEV